MFENMFLDSKLSKLIASKGPIGEIETFLKKHPSKRNYEVLLTLAIEHNNLDFVKYLSKSNKFDVNLFLDTNYRAYLAELAVMTDAPDVLEFLMSKGADLSLYNEYSDPEESLLESVVRHCGNYKNCTTILKVLIKYREHVTDEAIKNAKKHKKNPELLVLLERAKQDQDINGYKKSSHDLQMEEEARREQEENEEEDNNLAGGAKKRTAKKVKKPLAKKITKKPAAKKVTKKNK